MSSIVICPSEDHLGHCPEVIGPVFLGHFGHFLDFVPVGAVNEAQHHKVVSEEVITWT